MDQDLKIKLWNYTYMYLDSLDKASFNDISFLLFLDYFVFPIDEIPDNRILKIKENFWNFEWYQVYDFLEFILNIQHENPHKNSFKKFIINALEEEFSAFTIYKNKLVPISNPLEIKEIDESLESTMNLSSLEGANIHLNKSLEELSKKKGNDYRNSIKESISAVEAVCRVLTGESTLGSSLKKLEDKGFKIDNQLKAGLVKFYSYTNSKSSGIRHAIVDSPEEPDFDDAKFFLVVCSAFINYLIGKTRNLDTTSF